MEHTTPISTPKPSSHDAQPTSPADALAVSAADLIDLIRSGQGLDVNELVNRTLDDRRAA